MSYLKKSDKKSPIHHLIIMSKRFKQISIAILLLLAAGYFYISWTLSNFILFPESSMESTINHIADTWGTTYEDIMENYPEPENFQLTTADNIILKGKYFKNTDTADCAILMAHGWTSSWAGMLKYMPIFWDCGCDVAIYDHRMHGESGGKYATAGIKEKEDLVLVNEWLEEKTKLSNDKIGWVGSSWGAGAALQAAVIEGQQPAFILADAPYQDWYTAIFERAIRDYGNKVKLFAPMVFQIVNMRAGVNYKEASPIKAAPQIKAPVLLTHSKADASTASFQSQNIAKQLDPSLHQFHHLDWGGGHTMDVVVNQEKYNKLVDDFMEAFVPDFGTCNATDVIANEQ